MPPYITCFLLYFSISPYPLKQIVVVIFTQFMTLCNRFHNSLGNSFIHILAYLGHLIKCQYSKYSPVLSSMIALAKNVVSCARYDVWLSFCNSIFGYLYVFACSFRSLVFSSSCVIIGILLSLLFPLVHGVVSCTCYIYGSSGWYIFWATLRNITRGTLVVGWSIDTLRCASSLKIVSSWSIASKFDVPIFCKVFGGEGFFYHCCQFQWWFICLVCWR